MFLNASMNGCLLQQAVQKWISQNACEISDFRRLNAKALSELHFD